MSFKGVDQTFLPIVLPRNTTPALFTNKDSWRNSSQGSNMTLPSRGNETSKGDTHSEMTVHDIEYDMPLRKAILYVQIVIGILGAVLLFVYMIHLRR
ncbi:hypothetical protein PoB_000177900 [Plakobranchus ocellatus]|uniref:Uncharacterized protein n=1 Tax=Plakobranchus ocellatus TaxID=259542 RepID=A0AAV3XZA9_9GAST|nr:hypothetical protein PoB_000177900 [Plakobranchus ocellatus]